MKFIRNFGNGLSEVELMICNSTGSYVSILDMLTNSATIISDDVELDVINYIIMFGFN